ncbi:hypothetical protein RIF29_39465 [Crotalaria pallida]|uniref:Myb-like domain-containing protein n=1 Tax=Crotalaria pallida TaxID=3830 RepID=A0AAN9E1U7_CROPI
MLKQRICFTLILFFVLKMGGRTTPCYKKVGLKKGPWSEEEDKMLAAYVQEHGYGNWHSFPAKAAQAMESNKLKLRINNGMLDVLSWRHGQLEVADITNDKRHGYGAESHNLVGEEDHLHKSNMVNKERSSLPGDYYSWTGLHMDGVMQTHDEQTKKYFQAISLALLRIEGRELRIEYSFLRKVVGVPTKFQYKELEEAIDGFQAVIVKVSSA